MADRDFFTHLERIKTGYGEFVALDPNKITHLTDSQLNARCWVVAGNRRRVIEDFNHMSASGQPLADYVRKIRTSGWLDMTGRAFKSLYRSSPGGDPQPYVFLLCAQDLEPEFNQYGEVTP